MVADLPDPHGLTPLDPEQRGPGRAFQRVLEDRARARKETYRLAARRWFATLPEPAPTDPPVYGLPDLPTPDQVEAHANYVFTIFGYGLAVDGPGPHRTPELVALVRAARAYLAALWGSRWIEGFLRGEAEGPGGEETLVAALLLHQFGNALDVPSVVLR